MHWPLKNTYPLFPDEPGQFGAIRCHDVHTGVDLYCELGTEVVAMEDGEVVSIEQFTGGKESPWWNDTLAVLIRGKSGVIVYGEINSDLKVGDWVSAGERVGVVETSVLRKFKGRPMVMLHIELMTHDSCDHLKDPNTSTRGGTLWWPAGEPKPSPLLDITPLLMQAAAEECQRYIWCRPPERFDLKKYKGQRFLNLARFPKANTKQEVLIYYRNRSIQFLKFGWSWDGAWKEYDWGVQVELRSPEGESFYSVYVLEPGQGHLTKWFEDNPDKSFVTSSDCKEMVQWLNAKNYPHRVIDTWYSDEYRAIERFYGERRARRSGLHMMNHIDEGIFILQKIKASTTSMLAFALHPLMQNDEDLLSLSSFPWDSRAVALAMEYRHIANNHLAKKHDPKTPILSPLKEVNDMLIADKIQNCKDFESYLMGRADVPNSDRLSDYFHKEWFPALGISEELYQEIVREINQKTGRSTV